jgi:hypothetical protein
MVGHPWIADRAEVDRVEAAQAIEPVGVHHAPVLQVELAAVRELRELAGEPALPGRT